MTTKVLVTGAGGYIGRFVVEALLKKGIQVVAVDPNLNPESQHRQMEVISYDIFSGSDNVFEELERPDVCIHLAWKDGFIHNSEVHIKHLYNHYQFIKNLINGGLKHIAVMGTMHEVGYHVGEVNEDTPTNPFSLYGIAKNALRQSVELLVKDRPDVTLQWIRAFYIYGDDLNSKSIFSKIIQAHQDGKKLFPFTTGENKYDFISVSELAHQIVLTGLQKEVKGIINCCSGKPISLKEAVESFIKKHNLDIKLDYGVFPDRPYDSPAIWGSNMKINRILENADSGRKMS